MRAGLGRTRIFALAAFAVAGLLFPTREVEACGPFFEDEVFVRADVPDDLAVFAKGRLGILQPGYDSDEYAIAWRYLTGGTLSATEQSAITPPMPKSALEAMEKRDADSDARISGEESRPPELWEKARADYAPAIPAPDQQLGVNVSYPGNVRVIDFFLNCPDPSFETAVLTLKKRAAAWGRSSPMLMDWIHGQDAVFSNCDGNKPSMPASAPANASALLRADRAYQTAAANFYAMKLDEAAQQFSAIAADKDSPWHDWGGYLAARATIREAFALGKGTNPLSEGIANFDAVTMAHAQQMLETLLAQPNPEPSRAIVQGELDFVRIRTEPDRRAAEICAALSGPAPDGNLAQDLDDLSWMLQNKVPLKALPPLMEWIAAWRGAGTAATAYATWQQNHSLPWLVLAMVKAGPSDTLVPALLDAVKALPSNSPAYDTVFFHRVRLLEALKRSDEARALLDAALPDARKRGPSSALNALLGERMAAARDFQEFLEFAPRSALSTGSEGAYDLRGQCNEDAHAVNPNANCPELTQSPWLDEDAAQIFNQQVPLSLLIDAAQSPTLPENIRQGLAIAGWTRSVLLQDERSTSSLAPLLPQAMRDTAGSGDAFRADLAILRNPGVRPYLEPGVPRVVSFRTFDEFRDNWWCAGWDREYKPLPSAATPPALPAPSFLTAGQLTQAASELRQLQQLPDSVTLVGQRVLEYAKSHPDDPQVPEALALTVRATHYACQSWDPNAPDTGKSEYTPVSQAAFTLLHQRYPQSPWTRKTPYYY